MHNLKNVKENLFNMIVCLNGVEECKEDFETLKFALACVMFYEKTLEKGGKKDSEVQIQ